MSNTLVVLAHPQLQHSRITRQVLHALEQAALPGVAVTDLYARYPDFFIDVAREQQALAAAHTVVWLHPIHWYSMPALMKLWLDQVFAFGWAYGPGGRALAGKRLWLVSSTGGGLDSYSPEGHHRHAFGDFLLPYVQTARLTGMQWLPPLVLHAALRADDAAIAAHGEAMVQGLRRQSHATAGVASGAIDVVPADERPRG